jgi:formate dehydrogenase gamma subunit
MEKEEVNRKEMVRFTFNQVAQHIVLFILFILLAVTGLCLSFSETWLAQTLVKIMGGWEMRTLIHHVAGVLLVILGIYHVIFVFWHRKTTGKKLSKMLPRKKDIGDFFQYLKYIVGKGEKPQYDRFSWKEKFDYWGAFWGMCLMGITGVIMMRPLLATELLPYAWVNLSRILHSHEATIAISFITIWHLYNVHLSINRTRGVWLTGKISEEDMKDHHPLELKEIIESEQTARSSE